MSIKEFSDMFIGQSGKMCFKRLLEVGNVMCVFKIFRQRVPEVGGNIRKGSITISGKASPGNK